MLETNEELKARIEHEKRNLLFYSLNWEKLLQVMPEEELEKCIDLFLDRLILLLQLKVENRHPFGGVLKGL